ncbi:MAG: hypothetical protein E7B13_00810 [Clostridium sp.]|uniref:hypothetical protein n=1 Tax=Clostridium sp. TaxID=1506 RepID=UPI0028FF6B67|nr:hypothetical protein [Clostridium sp.]MDU3087955.1 hypothetical protein [Clostridium sp.]
MYNLNNKKDKVRYNLKDVYFIFADDVFVDENECINNTMVTDPKKISYLKFKNLIKFYALIYDRIIIPDSYLINNMNLHKFLLEEDGGVEYLRKNIIVCTMRNEINDIQDLFYNYRYNKTLNSNIEDDTIKRIFTNYDFKKTLKWRYEDVSENFAKHILESNSMINLNKTKSEIWKDIIVNWNEKTDFTRQEIYNKSEEVFGKGTEASKMIMQHADIVYNFNLPNMFNISSAYPERLLSNEVLSSEKVLSPEKVFFKVKKQTSAKLQPEDLFSQEILTLDEPLIFYSEILSQLRFEDILEIRETQEFKNYIKSITMNNPAIMQKSFFEYCMMCNELIPNMISANNGEIQKLNIKIKLLKSVEDTVEGVSSFIIDMVPLGNIVSIPIEYVISKGIEITGKKLTNRIALDYGLKSIEAKRDTKRSIKNNPKTILDDINEVFQINKLK